jgi:hypothetical protein
VTFVYGMITMAYMVAGLFFLKFWARGHDPLFIIFALAFWLLAASQILLAILEIPREEQGWAYILRLSAFSLIIIAIIQKNISRRSDR